jgi:hypothetical protein
MCRLINLNSNSEFLGDINVLLWIIQALLNLYFVLGFKKYLKTRNNSFCPLFFLFFMPVAQISRVLNVLRSLIAGHRYSTFSCSRRISHECIME